LGARGIQGFCEGLLLADPEKQTNFATVMLIIVNEKAAHFERPFLIFDWVFLPINVSSALLLIPFNTVNALGIA
jgi:hypothetical protein